MLRGGRWTGELLLELAMMNVRASALKASIERLSRNAWCDLESDALGARMANVPARILDALIR